MNFCEQNFAKRNQKIDSIAFTYDKVILSMHFSQLKQFTFSIFLNTAATFIMTLLIGCMHN